MIADDILLQLVGRGRIPPLILGRGLSATVSFLTPLHPPIIMGIYTDSNRYTHIDSTSSSPTTNHLQLSTLSRHRSDLYMDLGPPKLPHDAEDGSKNAVVYILKEKTGVCYV